MGTSFVNLYWNPPAFFVHRHCLMEYLPNEGRFVTCLMCMSNHIPSKGSGGRFYIPPLIWDWFHKSHLGGDPSLAKRGKARHKKVWFLCSTVVLGWVSALPWDNRSNLTLDIQLEKYVACTTILALGCTLVRVKYCNPTMDSRKAAHELCTKSHWSNWKPWGIWRKLPIPALYSLCFYINQPIMQ